VAPKANSWKVQGDAMFLRVPLASLLLAGGAQPVQQGRPRWRVHLEVGSELMRILFSACVNLLRSELLGGLIRNHLEVNSGLSYAVLLLFRLLNA
jgi:hypothetical protein